MADRQADQPLAVNHRPLAPWARQRPPLPVGLLTGTRSGSPPEAQKHPSVVSERCDQFFSLRNGFAQFFRLAAAGLGQIGFATATAPDHGRQRFDD